ncbi:MAG: hypothetical protein QOI34_701 [Verrucomicrobiota bacterium]
MESVGFKEWAVVCEALGQGRQSIIVRKGGIAEGHAGFAFNHGEFFLFPTWFHEQPQKVRNVGIELPQPTAGKIQIEFFAKLDLSRSVTSWEIARSLEPLHILQPEVVRERFEYDDAPGVHIGFVRVFRLIPTWTFADAKKYGGCRSWVPLPNPPTDLRFEPVLSDDEHNQRKSEFLEFVHEKQIQR